MNQYVVVCAPCMYTRKQTYMATEQSVGQLMVGSWGLMVTPFPKQLTPL